MGLLVAAPAPQAGAAPVKPVVNGPVFNDPFGTPAQQKAIFTQLVDLIDATPAGQTIRGSMFELADQAVADALLAAHARGVGVKLVVDDSTYVDANGKEYANAAYTSLKNGLGTTDTARSWIVVRDDRFEDADGVDDVQRGCLSVAPPGPAYNHNKFFLFSSIGPFGDGTTSSKVVFQTSSNLTNWYKVESFNDAVTFADGPVYDGYASYHEKLRAGRYLAGGNNNAYFSTPTGSTYRGYFFPRGDSSYNNPASDTIVNALDEVACGYTGTTASGTRPTSASSCSTSTTPASRSRTSSPTCAPRAAGSTSCTPPPRPR
ncbi:phospholipase D-like domain-containing protein [Streptomyces sp. NPDC056529]|uniref:phospholipase D-like domain-containing protein n=1 Tax=Streptomyces sp. NPDC056529 TaxID=3345855 RepID=UPI0036B04C6E